MQSAIERPWGYARSSSARAAQSPFGVFNRLIGLPITAFGYGHGEGIHSPNEYLETDTFFTSLEAAVRLYHNLGEIKV